MLLDDFDDDDDATWWCNRGEKASWIDERRIKRAAKFDPESILWIGRIVCRALPAIRE